MFEDVTLQLPKNEDMFITAFQKLVLQLLTG